MRCDSVGGTDATGPYKRILYKGVMFLQVRPINHGMTMCGIDRQGAPGLLEGLGPGQVLSLHAYSHISSPSTTARIVESSANICRDGDSGFVPTGPQDRPTYASRQTLRL